MADGQCVDRLCVKEGMLTIRYLHPTDSGKYICEARSKYGQDQRQVHLNVKVRVLYTLFLSPIIENLRVIKKGGREMHK